jgi:hypothetical protein
MLYQFLLQLAQAGSHTRSSWITYMMYVIQLEQSNVVACITQGFCLFGFALRCVALLCDVYVRLRLVVFPAGGPFLPSLSVKYVDKEGRGTRIIAALVPKGEEPRPTANEREPHEIHPHWTGPRHTHTRAIN